MSCFPSPPCVLAGAHFCGCRPKGMFWSCQQGRRLGLAGPRASGAPSSLSLVTVFRSREELPCLDSALPPLCPQLPSSAGSPPGCQSPPREAGPPVGRRGLGKRLPGSGLRSPSPAPGGEKPPHFRPVTRVPALGQPLGH
ncbi:hypothetical protein HJG60_009658 [Phyllostomus discolor]|uniref:Uncharacterized protein n=1 Tax=Phyllostomus discolor TaxID=89673 RepID=A0A834EL65_9CHIR|nr:hypothetical protein HJG60_009658 [Phyllostomus discolor]